MRVKACYHRMRIRVKLTCDAKCGSVGAGDRTRSEASSFRRLTVNVSSMGQPAARISGDCKDWKQTLLAPKVGAPFLRHGGETKHSSGDGRHSRLFFPADCISLAEECRAREGVCLNPRRSRSATRRSRSCGGRRRGADGGDR